MSVRAERVVQIGAHHAAQIGAIEVAKCQDCRAFGKGVAKPHRTSIRILKHAFERDASAELLAVGECTQIRRTSRERRGR